MHVGLAESITEYILLLKFLLFMAPGSYDNHTENAQLRALASPFYIQLTQSKYLLIRQTGTRNMDKYLFLVNMYIASGKQIKTGSTIVHECIHSE